MAFNHGWSAVGAIEESLGFQAALFRKNWRTRRLEHNGLHVPNIIGLERRCQIHFHLLTIMRIECLLNDLAKKWQLEYALNMMFTGNIRNFIRRRRGYCLADPGTSIRSAC